MKNFIKLFILLLLSSQVTIGMSRGTHAESASRGGRGLRVVGPAPRMRSKGTQMPEVIEQQFGMELPRVAIVLDSGAEPQGGPLLLQFGQMIADKAAPVIVDGSVLHKFFALRNWNESSDIEISSRDLIQQVRNLATRAKELDQFFEAAAVTHKELFAEKVRELGSIVNPADRQKLEAQRAEIDRLFTQEEAKYLKEQESIQESLRKKLDTYNDRKGKTPEFEFNYFLKSLNFDISDWDVYRHDTVDLFLFIPKGYQADLNKSMKASSAYKKLLPQLSREQRREEDLRHQARHDDHDYVDHKELAIRHRVSDITVTIADKHFLSEELATGFNLQGLTSVDSIQQLFTEVGYNWKSRFFKRGAKPAITSQDLQDMFIKGDMATLKPVFKPLLVYMVGYGTTKSEKLVSMQSREFYNFITKLAPLMQTLYFVNCGDSNVLSTRTLHNQQADVIAGSIEEPQVYRDMALLPNILGKEELPFNLTNFFATLDMAAQWKRNAMNTINKSIREHAAIEGIDHAAVEGQKVDGKLVISQEEYIRRTRDAWGQQQLFFYSRLREAVDFATPTINNKMVMAGTQIPFIWDSYRAKFLPLIGAKEVIVDNQHRAANASIVITDKEKVFFEIANVSTVSLLNGSNTAPSFISLTPADEPLTVIKAIQMDHVTLKQFLEQSIFSLDVFAEKTWRIKQLVLSDSQGALKYYQDVTIKHAPVSAGWISGAAMQGSVSYKVMEDGSLSWYNVDWNFKEKEFANERKERGASKAWRADYNLLTQPYQHWADTLRRRDGWDKKEAQGGASDLMRTIIEAAMTQRDAA